MGRRPKIAEAQELSVDPEPSDIIRFLEKIKVDGVCWMWQGRTDENGYGRFDYAGTQVGAHRFAYAVFKGTVPAGRHVHHDSCRHHSCVYPGHLWCKTPTENSSHAAKLQRAEPLLFRRS